jgi:hypothetical protein
MWLAQGESAVNYFQKQQSHETLIPLFNRSVQSDHTKNSFGFTKFTNPGEEITVPQKFYPGCALFAKKHKYFLLKINHIFRRMGNVQTISIANQILPTESYVQDVDSLRYIRR